MNLAMDCKSIPSSSFRLLCSRGLFNDVQSYDWSKSIPLLNAALCAAVACRASLNGNYDLDDTVQRYEWLAGHTIRINKSSFKFSVA